MSEKAAKVFMTTIVITNALAVIIGTRTVIIGIKTLIDGTN